MTHCVQDFTQTALGHLYSQTHGQGAPKAHKAMLSAEPTGTFHLHMVSLSIASLLGCQHTQAD